MLSIKTRKLLALAVFSVLFLVTRMPLLGYDEINPDAVNWHFRAEQFIVGLKSQDFSKTYQHYHPGVTLMWTMGVPIEIYRQINPQDRIYTEDNFLIQHKVAKISLVSVQLILSLIVILTLKKIIGFKKSLLTVSILTFEPFFLGNSRILHMDVLLALFAFLALMYAYIYHLNRSARSIALAGLFSGLAFLTKSVGALTIPFIVVLTVLSVRRTHQKAGVNALHIGVFLAASVATIFLVFPALWTDPVFVLSDIYKEGLRIGTRRGHEQIVMGQQTDVAGLTFYPIVLALKTSPIIWLGVAFFIYQLIANYRKYQKLDRVFLLYLCSFYLLYFVGMSAASKKIDRYMLPIYPLLAIFAAIGISQATSIPKKKREQKIVLLAIALITGIGLLYPLLRFYPYYFTYTNPIFGTAERANILVGQKPFGIGIPELKTRVTERYGNNVNLGFVDRKPMSMIYKNSKLFDIRESGTSKYDLIILGPNEEMPENVTGGKFKFTKDDSMYINTLEFWRIYKKDLNSE